MKRKYITSSRKQLRTMSSMQYLIQLPVFWVIQKNILKTVLRLIKSLKMPRIQFIVGQIDEEQLKAQWDLWSKSGGDKVIEEVNAVYAK